MVSWYTFAPNKSLINMKTIFLDIDGVIQPLFKLERFKHMHEIIDIARELDSKIPGYSYHDYVTQEHFMDLPYTPYIRQCDLAAVYYDWSKDAVEHLRHALDCHDAKIVISSSWRDNGEHVMKAFLAIYDLDKYFYGMLDGKSHSGQTESQKKAIEYFNTLRSNENPSYDWRAAEIRDYLSHHPEITSYVAIDDYNLGFPVSGHFVHCNDGVLDIRKRELILSILDIEDGPYSI